MSSMGMTIRSQWTRIIDAWTYYAYKAPWQSNTTSGKPLITPGWVGAQHWRRLWAYNTLESYYRNSARNWINADADDDVRRQRREYGDPHLLVEQTRSSLYGDKISIKVKGAIGTDDAGAVTIQELLEEWWEDEIMEQKLIETDRNAIKLGDGVMAIGWDAKKKRPRVQIYNPGFYFPCMEREGGGCEDYPEKVHIAWEFCEEDGDGNEKRFVRRITWQMMEYADNHSVSLPWEDDPVTETCYFQDGVWSLDDMGKDVDLFDDSKARWMTEPTDLGIDFIPVIHIPNKVSLEEHFGESMLASVLQILDDIVATDTDLQAASATTGSPPIAISGAMVDSSKTVYGPGTILSVGDGSATVVDTSNSLTALLALKDALLERLSVNARIPEALLGRVKPNEVPSGIALALGFTPHSSLIAEMRLVRRQKYGLLLKFVQRFYMMNGFLTEVRSADIVFGSFLPADKQETMTLIVGLYTIKAISLETCIAMMMASGYPIEDAAAEIDRIMSEDVSTASALVSLTGDVNLGRERLGLPPDPTMVGHNLNDQQPPPGQ